MVGVTIKALLLIWPFLKRAVFGDRTIKEVMLENKHVTFMFAVVVILLLSFFMTVSELDEVRSENVALKKQLAQVCPTLDKDAALKARRKALGDLLK